MAKMKAVAPQIAAIREKYPDDKMKQQQETMALYKREKINPVSGCLPMLIQIPVFFALYKVLFVTIEMRHAPFFGWIKDLSAPDPTNVFNLFGLLPYRPDAAAGHRPFPRARHLAAADGRLDVRADEGQSGALRSDAEADVHLDAGDLHLHHGRLSLRPRDLLDLEQHAVDPPADRDHEKSRRRKSNCSTISRACSRRRPRA